LIVHDSTWSLSCTEHMQSQLLRVALVAQHEHPAVFADLGPPHACGECSKAAGHRMFICHDFFLMLNKLSIMLYCIHVHTHTKTDEKAFMLIKFTVDDCTQCKMVSKEQSLNQLCERNLARGLATARTLAHTPTCVHTI